MGLNLFVIQIRIASYLHYANQDKLKCCMCARQVEIHKLCIACECISPNKLGI